MAQKLSYSQTDPWRVGVSQLQFSSFAGNQWFELRIYYEKMSSWTGNNPDA
jgi:hypothetical protein